MNAFLPTFTILDAGYSQGSSGGAIFGPAIEGAIYSNSSGELCIWFDEVSVPGWYIIDEEGNPGAFVSSAPEPGGDWVLNQ